MVLVAEALSCRADAPYAQASVLGAAVTSSLPSPMPFTAYLPMYFLQLNNVCKTPWLPALSCTYPECLILPPAAFSGSSFTLESAATDQAAGPPLLLRAAVKAAVVSHINHIMLLFGLRGHLAVDEPAHVELTRDEPG
ncbi:hypothetical protein AMECASPLE_030927 [Ameca splendens]|uniref:Uncharacterized protein n=1 Tax=Ameca splendens TaxID=208324 RepID=A0ABV0XVG7_9TELE